MSDGAPRSSSGPTLSIVIVSFNCKDHLLQCLDSVDGERSEISLEVIVVDNASIDGTLDAVRDRYPWVHRQASRENRGFAWASNQGLARANGTYLLLLNPDTVVLPGSLTKVVQALEARPAIGMLGCKLVQSDGALDRACKRGFPTPLSSLYHFTGLSRLFPRSARFAQYTAGHVGPDDISVVDAVNGAFMLVRRAAVEAVGPLDERYWMYMEDLDWCYRFREHGWPVLYWPLVEVVHAKGGSSGHPRPWRTNYAFHRGMWLFYRSHYASTRPLAVTILVWLGVWLKLAGSAIRSLAHRTSRQVAPAAR